MPRKLRNPKIRIAKNEMGGSLVGLHVFLVGKPWVWVFAIGPNGEPELQDTYLITTTDAIEGNRPSSRPSDFLTRMVVRNVQDRIDREQVP